MAKRPFGPDELAFLKAIHANPADDLPRLVYADWLDERGDPLAEMIRLGVEARDDGRTDLKPRIDALATRLRPRYVSPVPMRMRFSHWRRGLPVLTCNLSLSDLNFEAIFRNCERSTSPLYAFSLEVFYYDTSGLESILRHPFMKQVHWLQLSTRPYTTVADIETLARSPAIGRIEHIEFVRHPVGRDVVSAIMKHLAPKFLVEWMEYVERERGYAQFSSAE